MKKLIKGNREDMTLEIAEHIYYMFRDIGIAGDAASRLVMSIEVGLHKFSSKAFLDLYDEVIGLKED